MSMAEPLMPAHESKVGGDPREHDVDGDVDVFIDSTADDETEEVHEDAPRPPFRTPAPHEGLTDEQLQQDLDSES